MCAKMSVFCVTFLELLFIRSYLSLSQHYIYIYIWNAKIAITLDWLIYIIQFLINQNIIHYSDISNIILFKTSVIEFLTSEI